MLYPYTRKFLTLDEIKDSLNGYARIIEFHCFMAGSEYCSETQEYYPDPTQEGAYDKNWILSITEG